VDTSDDPQASQPDEDALDGADAGTDAATDTDEAGAAPGPGGNLALGVLAAVAVAALGVLVWTVLLLSGVKWNVAGITVIAGLAAGYLIRRVSGRSGLGVRVTAAVIIAVAAVVGTVTSVLAFTSHSYKIGFGTLLKHYKYRDTFTLLKHLPARTLVIYAAAVVIAFLSAGPQKPKAAKAGPADEPVAPVAPVAPPEAD
jgi:hypothetical protein